MRHAQAPQRAHQIAPAGTADAELVQHVRDRDEVAIRSIMQSSNRRLYRLARGILRNDGEAEDVVQETYVRAFTQISMENLVISPAEASAKVGGTIEWINKDIFAHTSTAQNGDWDVTMPPKKTVTSVLKKAGTIEYYCRFHPNMKATLIVTP